MSQDRLREDYARLLVERRPVNRDACVPPEALAALVTGKAPEADRLAWLRHVSACAPCRAELDLLRGTAAATRRLHTRWSVGLGRAAAIVLLATGAALVWRAIGTGNGAAPMRGGEPAVELLTPAGELTASDGRDFAWRSVPEALDYRFELLNESGNVVLEQQTGDTLLQLPDSIAITPGQEYQWWVRAQLRDGSVLRSPLQRFRIISQ